MNKKIIILDDVVEQRELLLKLLQEANYKVFITETESELLDSISNINPDIILLSATLKDKDCYLICKKIKVLEISENIPVIFININQNSFDAEIMFNAGGCDYINYPFSIQETLHRIDTQIKLKSLEDGLIEKTKQLHKLIPHYQKLKLALEKAKLELANVAQKDQHNSLTSKEAFEKILQQEWLRGARQRSSFGDLTGTNISLIMAKINDFITYQNNHEKDLTDNCLGIVGKTLQSTVKRPGDVVSTFTQGVFVILLPNTDEDGAQTVAQMINSDLEILQIPHHYSNFSEYISLSFGIATGIPSQGLPPTILIEVAQNALNNALSQKQNNVIIADKF